MTDEEKAALEAQRAACARAKMPQFAPSNGVCWSCRRWIYGEGGANPKSPVTGCPFCMRSYCD